MPPIKIALIGTGHLGERHLQLYSEMNEAVVIAGICDIEPERAARLGKQYGVVSTTDYRTLPADIDAVDICVPTTHHFEIADFFLEQGKHIFVEKPFTNTVEQADQLIEKAETKNLKIQVGHVERFNAAFEAVKHFATRPLFIECHRLNQFPNRSLDIGVIMDLMIHDIDIMLGLIDSPIQNISAVGVNVLTAKEDIASVRITFENGCVCNLTASRVSEDVMRKIRIFQEDTYISLDYVRQEAFIYRKSGTQILKHALPIEKEQPLKKELEHFVDCLLHDTQPLISGPDGRKALKLALTIEQQIREHLASRPSPGEPQGK